MTKKKPNNIYQLNAAKYNIGAEFYLGADLPWRDKARVVKTRVAANTPQEAWRKLMMESLIKLDITDGKLILGFLLNLVNSLDTAVRETLVVGIIEGMGLSLERDPAAPEQMVGNLVQRFTSLAMGESAEKRTPSGLILPNGDLPHARLS